MFVNRVVGRHLSRPKHVQAFGAGLRALGLELDAQPSMTCHDWDPIICLDEMIKGEGMMI